MIEQDTRKISPTTVLRWMEESFSVDAECGSLIWKNPPRRHPRLKGTPAGSVRSNRGKSYVHIKMDGVPLKRSWLIFLWVNRRWPTYCIDHINGNPTNDGIGNLREASRMQNAWNHKTRAKQEKTPMGVRRLPSGRYLARIRCNHTPISLGTFGTAAEAHAAYLGKRKELFGEYA